MLQTGLEMVKGKLSEQVQYDIRLSDSYKRAGQKYGEKAALPDLDAVVHVYDFRMVLDEVMEHIEKNILPDHFKAYDSDLRDYALAANGITYMQRAVKDEEHERYITLSTVAEYLELLEDIGESSDSLRRLIMEKTDTQVLHKWLKAAAKADSIDEFEKSIDLVSGNA